MIHGLKIKPEYFAAVRAGLKTFEIRKNDRNFKLYDEVLLCEWNGEYTKREIRTVIKYITDYAQAEGYVVFSFEIIEVKP